jgi:hypothetical protein
MYFVYFIKETGTENTVKIGYCSNLNQRLSALQCGNHRRLYYYTYINVGIHKQIEKNLHSILKEKNLRGEWFYLTDKEIDTIKNDIKEYLLINNLF